MKRHTLILIATFAVAAVIGGCSGGSTTDEVVLLTHESFALSEGTLEAFTEETGVTVTVRAAGDAGSMVNQAILTKDNPIADVLYGIDNTFISRALAEGIFLPHEAASIGTVPEALHVEGNPVTPIDFGDVCVNYDIAALVERGVEPPSTLADLTEPVYRDLLVVQNPATSSPGLAFLFATIAAFPEDAAYDWRDYWTDLFSNGVAVVSDWTQAYSVEFTRAGGDRPLVVSYASSPPFEVLYGELTEAPTGVMTDGCFRQVEYAGVLAGTANEDAARRLVDFLLSVPVQEDIPLNMFVYPANSQAELPAILTEFSVLPDDPASIDPALIEANRERWIEEWTTIARS
ncbi:MAG: thiamine ABC transporter substrate-binding protein [Acidimicrobiia bacterium]